MYGRRDVFLEGLCMCAKDMQQKKSFYPNIFQIENIASSNFEAE